MDRGRIEIVARWMGTFLRPGQVTEVRALNLPGRKMANAFFDAGRVEELATRALEFEAEGASGVYFTPNPLRADAGESRRAAADADVIGRHWLLIDVDPVRASHTAATDEERRAAWDVLSRVRGSMEAAGFVGEVLGDSGNGWHACYPLDLPNDDQAKEKIRGVLRGLDQRCSDSAAKVDTTTFNAARIWKLYGTKSRKGEEETDRPHRWSRLLAGQAPSREFWDANGQALSRLLLTWARQDEQRRGRERVALNSREVVLQRARLYIAKEPPAISGQAGHNRTFHVACVLVQGFALSVEEGLAAIQEWNRTCQPPWTDGELRHKLESAEKNTDKPRGYLLNGNGSAHSTPGPASAPEEPRKNAENSDDPLDQDATAADLVLANATIRWCWTGWVPLGVLTILASEPGVGKTRFCADLARRLAHGLPWPDGTPNTYPVGTRTLWVPADNQHAELGTLPTDFGFGAELIVLNATRRNPFNGTLLDGQADLADFEARIRRVKPGLVVIDTILNATDRSSHKPEDAKALFVPLQQLAARTGSAVVCVTHLNAAGKPLGRRIVGQGRVVMQLEQPDPDGQPNRRKLYVTKSNSLFPAPLGVTMGSQGNEYDPNPPQTPVAPEPGETGGRPAEKVQAAAQWLRSHLADGNARVSRLRTESEADGINSRNLYRAKDLLDVVELQIDGRKFWRLPTDEERE